MLPFRTAGDVSSGFQSQSGQPDSHFGRGVDDVHPLRFTSHATPVDLLAANIVASHFPNMHILAKLKCEDLLISSQMR